MTASSSDALVFFGATGDLAYKKIFPALQAMIRHGDLDIPIIGMARAGWTLDKLRDRAHDSLEKNGGLDAEAFAKLVAQLKYVDGDYGDPATYERLKQALGGASRPLYYLAIPPSMFGTVVQGLAKAGSDQDARVVVEKPFGRDLASAQALNRTLHEVFQEQPSAEELDHDFLWRTTRRLPERGRIGIFNRSYYEEVHIVCVHPEIFRNHGIPDELIDEKTLWKGRYCSIVDLEEHLHSNGTRIIKFFLHLSKDEQKNRFLERTGDPNKNWKFGIADVEERKFWDHYMISFEGCLRETSTNNALWYVVPADDKHDARPIISEITLDTMKQLKMSYPEADEARIDELKSIRELL